MSQSRGDGERQGRAEHGRALHARRRHRPRQFHQMVLHCSSLGQLVQNLYQNNFKSRTRGLAVSLCYLRFKFFSRNYLGPYSFPEGCLCWRLNSARTFFHGSHVTKKMLIALSRYTCVDSILSFIF
ncbi:uncharacterized protein [Triticum aestivum]|uniref:uncharacterized protein isoform X1 n=1 Tax=Triticum aestivum TaxID=4565 RepID=UPI001D00B857|nr:uncharacterized protein LOC123133370 isoform X1 [Triticum aestivum]